MNVLGIDLSGPHNVRDTYAAQFSADGSTLRHVTTMAAVDDKNLIESITSLAGSETLVIGIDAPLSYNPGGGDRPSDRLLRQLINERGGGVAVMPPTMTRMAYLTLRGVALTRMIEALGMGKNIRSVEVHPGAAMLIRGAPRSDLVSLKKDPGARLRLLDWLSTQNVVGIPRSEGTPDHLIMACAAALAAWSWHRGAPAWCSPAAPPLHPYDFAC